MLNARQYSTMKVYIEKLETAIENNDISDLYDIWAEINTVYSTQIS